MQSDTTRIELSEVSTVPGHEVIVLVHRLIITTLIAAVGYSMFLTSSQARCPGGINADGGLIDAFGRSTEVAPPCISITMRPSTLVYLVLALIVVWAVTKVVQKGQDEAAALRILGWTGPTVILVAVLAVVLSHAAFFSIPIESWNGTGALPIPGWLDVDVVITPMASA